MDLFDRFIERMEKVALYKQKMTSSAAREQYQHTRKGSLEHDLAKIDLMSSDKHFVPRSDNVVQGDFDLPRGTKRVVPENLDLSGTISKAKNEAVERLAKETGSIPNKLYRFFHGIK